VIFELGVAFALGLAAVAKRRRPADPVVPPPADPDPGPLPPPKASPVGWVQLQDALGLEVRAPSRSWTSPAVRELMLRAGELAADLGATLQIGDVGPAERGTEFKTGTGAHLSHRWGRDLDIAYHSTAYPTPDDVPVDPRIIAVLDAIAPFIEVVGVNAVRAPAFGARVSPKGKPFRVSTWDGHAHHLHLRLRPELVDEP
jgi:hypothetical protein